MTDLEKITEAKAFYKANKKFFKKFRFYYSIANHPVVRFVETACIIGAVLIVLGFVINSTGFVTFPKWTKPVALYGIAPCILIAGFLHFFEVKQDELYEYYYVDNTLEEMYGYMDGLALYFWTGGRIRKILRMLKKNQARTIREAAKSMKPKFDDRKFLFDVDRYNEISEKAIERQNAIIEKRNEKHQKEQEKIARKDAFWNAVGGAILETALSSADIPIEPISSEPVARPRETVDNSAAEAEQRRKADRERELKEYAQKADYWEDEYYRLLASDPQCLNDKTKVAEYNKNYFRRLSRG